MCVFNYLETVYGGMLALCDHDEYSKLLQYISVECSHTYVCGQPEGRTEALHSFL